MFHFNKKKSCVLLINSFVPCQTAPTEHEYFSGHIFHYPLGDYVLKLCEKVCFK